MSAPPVTIDLEDVRIDLDGVPLCQHVSARATGCRILLSGRVGAAVALAISHRARTTSGRITLDGVDAACAAHLGIAPIDLPLPQHSTVLRFLQLGHQLAGLDAPQAIVSALAVVSDLGIQYLAERRLHTLRLAERRAVIIAQAMACNQKILFAEAPLALLEPPDARFVLDVLGRVCLNYPVVATAQRLDPSSAERQLLLGSDQLALLSDNGSSWIGSPHVLLQSGRLFALSVRGKSEEFLGSLRQSGISIQGDPPRFIVELPVGCRTEVVVRAAQASHTVLLDLIPLWDSQGDAS